MQRSPLTFLPARLAAAASLFGLVACNPTFNWRDVRPEGTALGLLLPCKPDKVEKKVALGDRPVTLRLLGCDAGDATFALSVADVGDASRAAAVLAQWQRGTLANMKAAPAEPMSGQRLAGRSDKSVTEVMRLKLPGAAPLPTAVLVKARGQRTDGSAVSGQAAYFAQGSQVFQAVIYAPEIKPEVAETFFSSLTFE